MDVQIRFLYDLLLGFYSSGSISSSVTKKQINQRVEIQWNAKFRSTKQKYSNVIVKSGFKENTIYPKAQWVTHNVHDWKDDHGQPPQV